MITNQRCRNSGCVPHSGNIGTFHHCGSMFGRWYDMIWMEKMIGDPARAEEKPDPLIPYPELKRGTERKDKIL